MKILTLLLVCLLLVPASFVGAQTTGTAFTYQGQLVQSDVPVDEAADFIFTLFNATTGGTQIGSPINLYGVQVVGGVFDVQLDFGTNAFNGDARYLQIAVRTPSTGPGGGGSYTTLLPRQALTPVPYAIHALNVVGGGGAWEQVGSAITNTNGGFVGINRSSPLTSAEVFGIQSSQTSSYGGMYLGTDGTQARPFYGYSAGGQTLWTYQDGPTDSWRVYNSGDRLTVLNNGNVGIGTNTPGSRLEVGGVIESNVGGFRFPDGTVQITAASGGGGGADNDWVINGPNVYNVTADDVMIGTSTPANGAKLTVGGGDFGLTTIDVNGTLGGSLKLRGNGASVEILAAVDEGRVSSGPGQDLSVLSGQNLFIKSGTGGFQQFHTNGIRRMRIDENGLTDFFHSNNNPTVTIDGEDVNGGGRIELKKSNGFKSVEIVGANAGGAQAGSVNLYTDSNPTTPTVILDGEYGGTAGGALVLRNSSGQMGIELVSDLTPNEQAEIRMYTPTGQKTLEFEAQEGGDPAQGSTIKLFDDAGNLQIELDAEQGTSGIGRIITPVIEITGGSDLSEQFDVRADDPASIEPGSVVSIDPFSPGDLRLSTAAYDRRVAGIISGAGGVRPGMLMGQRGSEADGQHPVALTGRVYCKVDASYGPIEAGDLLTTSPTAGHAMKVTDHSKATGAVLGKAMSSHETGRGMVLVLVSLQ